MIRDKKGPDFIQRLFIILKMLNLLKFQVSKITRSLQQQNNRSIPTLLN